LIFLRERVRLVTDSLSETSPTDAGVSPRSPNMGMRHSRNSPCTPFFCWVLLGDRLTNRGHVRWEVSSASLPLVAWQPLLTASLVTVRLQTCSVLCCSSTTSPNKIAISKLPLRLCRHRGIFKGDESHPQMAWSPP